MQNYKIDLKEIILLIVGCILMAISLTLLFDPNSIAPGGLTGLAIVINSVVTIPLWLINLVLNIPLFICAYKILSKQDCIKTILGIVFLTIALKATEGLSYINFTDDLLLASIFGSVLMGLGLGVILRINGTTGGTDLIGLLLNKFFPHLSVPLLMGIADLMVVILSAIVSKEVEIGLYSAISLYVIVKVSDLVIEGMDYSKSFMIISDEYTEIGDKILEKLDRGATVLKGEGYYTKHDKNILLVVVSRRQVVTLKKLVKEIDPSAFIIITDIHEALGNGFKSMNI